MYENNILFKTHLMFQSVPAVNIPLRATWEDSHILLARSPGFFPRNFCLGFRSGNFFQKLIKIYSVSLFLVNVFERLLRTSRKTLAFVHNNYICFLKRLYQINKKVIILFEASATKKCPGNAFL